MSTKQYAAPQWRKEINQYLTHLRASGQREASVQTRSRQLVALSHDIHAAPWEVTPDDLLAWFESKDWARETRRSARDAARGFYEWGMRTGLCDTNPAYALPHVQRSTPTPHPCPDHLIHAALESATPDVQLMIRLAAECGLRRSEIAQVASADVLDAHGEYSLIVHGKGGRQRIVPISPDLAEQVIAADGYAFPGRFGGPVEASYVGKRVGRMLPNGYSCHSLRHRYATRLYAQTRDILLVSRLLGHTKIETTQAYVAIPTVDMSDMLAAISVH
ncbi:MAG: tyrosine-type recombinase/integrase [Bifidobacterium choerinum]